MAEHDALVLDARSLDRLKASATRDPRGAARRAAVQFEAMFMQMVLKSMRDAVPQSGILDGPGSDLYKGMLDTQFAQNLSGQPGGLGAMIERQLLRATDPEAAPRPLPRTQAERAPQQGVSAAVGGAGAKPASQAAMVGLPPAIAQRAAAAFAQAAALRSAQQGDVLGKMAPMPMLGSPGGPVQDAAKGFQREFVDRTWSAARVAETTTGVPAAFIVGQAALETGWGRYEIKRPDGRSAHNLFGIKADARWSGDVVEATTTEYVGGRAVKRVERFRAYPNDAAAFSDWSRLMVKNPRYKQVLQSQGDLQGFAQGIQRAGYATDPAYASKLERTITQVLSSRRRDT